MMPLLAVLVALLLVSGTVADSSSTSDYRASPNPTKARLAALDVAWAQPSAAEVAGGMCVGLPKVPYFASMKGCSVPAAVGYTCSVTCAKK